MGDLATEWNLYGITPKLQAEWLRVWQIAMNQEQSHIISVDQISFLALLGSAIAMKNGNYIEAAEMWTPYFQHPDFQTEREDIQVPYTCLRCQSYLFAGDMSRAIEGYRSALSTAPAKEQAMTAMLILENIRGYCLKHPSTAEAEPELVDLAEEVKMYAPKMARPPADPRPRTYEELAEETYRFGLVWEDD